MPVIVGSLLLLPVFLGIAIYLAYSQGLVVTKCIAAMLFVFRPGKYGDQATVNVCNGWVRHRVRFQEDRSYAFVLDACLSAGDMEVRLLDGKMQTLLRLNQQYPAGKILVERTGRYYPQWDFRGASGKFALRW